VSEAYERLPSRAASAAKRRAQRAKSRAGFTLLEVMAAVAVLGFTVAVLARGAIQGMRYEGDASRRLAASLLADRALFELESALALGALPQLGHQEREEGGEFLLSLDVAPLDPAALGIGALFTREPEAGGAAPSGPQAAVPELLLVTVQVVWTDGLVEQTVTRTTFAYDASQTAEALGAAEGAGAEEPEAEVPAEGEEP
jgi:prepilin-type N-terminal cleavage/methylation domain-containing protein